MIDRNELKTKVGDTIFSVKFIKKGNGEIRHMLCRFGVHKQVSGVGLTEAQRRSDIENNNVRVFDMQKSGWRTIPLDNILEITFKKRTFTRDQIQERGLYTIMDSLIKQL